MQKQLLNSHTDGNSVINRSNPNNASGTNMVCNRLSGPDAVNGNGAMTRAMPNQNTGNNLPLQKNVQPKGGCNCPPASSPTPRQPKPLPQIANPYSKNVPVNRQQQNTLPTQN